MAFFLESSVPNNFRAGTLGLLIAAFVLAAGSQANTALQRARQLMQAGRLAQAESVLMEASRLSNGSDAQVLFALAQVEFALGKRDEAITLTRQLSKAADDNAELHSALGRLLHEHGANEAALEELGRAHSLAPGDVPITTELVIAHLDAKRSAAAESLLRSLVSSAPYSDLVNAGSRLGEAGHYDAAARLFRRAVEMRPDAYDARFDLAFALYQVGNSVAALKVVDELAPLSPNRPPDYLYLRGKIEAALGHLAAAEQLFLAAVAQQPDNESLCSDLGLLYFRRENFHEAEDVLSQCAKRLPDSTAVASALALTHFRLGKYDQAIAGFEQVLRTQPDADAAREGLAFLLYVTGRAADAHRWLASRLAATDADYALFYLDALALLRTDALHNSLPAMDALDKALQRNPQFAPAYFERGKLQENLGDPAGALADFEKAITSDSGYAAPYYHMARIFYRKGNVAGAQRAQQRYAQLTHEEEEKQQARLIQARLLQAGSR